MKQFGQTLKKTAVFLLAGIVVSAVVSAQETPAAKVLDVSGQAEFMLPTWRRWEPLHKETALQKGAKVRTGRKGSAHLVFDENLATVVKLDKSSQMVLGHGMKISLEKGRLFIMREEGALGLFEIRTRRLKVRMARGGCIIDCTKKGALVRVYGDDVLSADGTIKEGYKFWKPADKKKSASRKRMVYTDYVVWQAWTRQWYEMRDDFFAERLEKEMNP